MLNDFKAGLRATVTIGLLLCLGLLSACSRIGLGYTNAPSLITWWLDGYVDFDSTQSTRMRADLQTLLDWHRKEELPQWAMLLKDMQNASDAALSADEACRLSAALEARVIRLTERVLPVAASAAMSLTPAQLDHLQAAFEKRNVEWREQWLEGTPGERAQRRLKKLVERTESFYGPLSDDQNALLKQQIAASLFDPVVQYREIQRRQQAALQVLRKLRSSGATEAQTLAALKVLVADTRQSPDSQFEAYSNRLRLAGCASIARIHASTNTTQRTRLQQTLKDYEADVRAVMLP